MTMNISAEMPPPLPINMSLLKDSADRFRSLNEMLITSSDMKSRGAITSSENSLEGETNDQMPKFKKGLGARIDHLMYANSLVPFIHIPPPVPKPDPPTKGKGGRKAGPSSQPSTGSASATTCSSKRGSQDSSKGGNKKARTVDQSSESAVSALLALGGR